MVTNRKTLFLMHVETGQRYPLTEKEIVIGRSSGDILYPQDSALSNQHCVLVQGEDGWTVRDLNSAAGTWLNQKRLNPGQNYLLKPQDKLQLGEQSLQLIEIGARRRRRRRRSKKKNQPPDSDTLFWFLVFTVVVGLGFALLHGKSTRREVSSEQKPLIMSPFDLVDRETQAAFESYKKMSAQFKDGQLSETETARKIRAELIPTFQEVARKLSVVKGSTEYERKKSDLNLKMLKSLSQQLSAYANLVETKNPKFSAELEKFSLETESLKKQLNQLRREKPEDR